MALIKCPECRNKVSDKAENCIHCGYPINSNMIVIEKINGLDYDISFVKDNNLSQADKMLKMLEITGNDFECAMKAKEIVLKYHPTQKEDSNKVHCPKCGSTNIQLVKRKWSPLTGFMTNKVDRICVNCKCKF